MSYVLPDVSPVQIARGVTTTVTFRVYSEDEEAVTVSTASAVLRWGVTTIGTYSASYSTTTAALSATVPGADTETLTLDDTPASIAWAPVIGGVTEAFLQRAIIARRVVHSLVLSSDLTARYPELSDLATTTELRADLAEAWRDLRRDLEAHGVEWWRARDPDALARMQERLAASRRYAKAAQDAGDARWMSHAERLMAEYRAALDAPMLVDQDEDDVADSQPEHATSNEYWWSTERRS